MIKISWAEWQNLPFGFLSTFLPESRQICQGRPADRAFILPLIHLAAFWYQSGNRPSYIMPNSP